MATRIRLKRIGRKNRPFYRVIVIDSRQRRDGAAIEEIGWYNPIAQDKSNNFELNEERILHWLNLGAQPSDIAQNLIKRAGIAMKWHLMKQGLDEKAIDKEIQKFALRKESQAKDKLAAADKESKKKAKESEKKVAAAVEEEKTEEQVVVDKTEESATVESETKETDDKVEEKTQPEEKVEEKKEDGQSEETEKAAIAEEKPAISEPEAEVEAEVKEEVTTTKKSAPKETAKANESAENAESTDEAKDEK